MSEASADGLYQAHMRRAASEDSNRDSLEINDQADAAFLVPDGPNEDPVRRRPSRDDRVYSCQFGTCGKKYSNTHSRRQV